MTIQDWGSIGEMIGGIAVVATLIYLAIQVRQSTTTDHSSATQAWTSGMRNLVDPIMYSEQMTKVLTRGWVDPKQLDEVTWLQFIVWHQQLCYQIDSVLQMYRAGSVDETLWKMELGRGVGVLSFPGAYQWWEAGGKNQVSEELSNMLDERITANRQSWAVLWWSKEQGFYTLTEFDTEELRYTAAESDESL